MRKQKTRSAAALRKSQSIAIGGRMRLPREIVTLCVLVARRTGETPNCVMNRLFRKGIKRIEEDPSEVDAYIAARDRYCKLEGVDPKEKSFRDCQLRLQLAIQHVKNGGTL